MICDRTKLIDNILNLCNRLDQHEMRTKYQKIKLTIFRNALFKPNFVGEKGNEKETIKKAVEQLYTCLLYTSPSPRDQRGSRMPSSA